MSSKFTLETDGKIPNSLISTPKSDFASVKEIQAGRDSRPPEGEGKSESPMAHRFGPHGIGQAGASNVSRILKFENGFVLGFLLITNIWVISIA